MIRAWVVAAFAALSLAPAQAASFSDIKGLFPPTGGDARVRNPTIFLWNAAIAASGKSASAVFDSYLIDPAYLASSAGAPAGPSLMVAVRSQQAADVVYWTLSKRVRQRTGAPLPPVSSCDEGDVACCSGGPSLDCLLRWHPGPDGLGALEQAQWLATMLDLLSVEITASSRRYTLADLRAKSLPPNAILLLWDDGIARSDSIVTVLDAALLERLSITTARLATALGDVSGTSVLQSTLVCPQAGNGGGASQTILISRVLPSGRRSAAAAVPSAARITTGPNGISVLPMEAAASPNDRPMWTNFVQADHTSGGLVNCVGQDSASQLLAQPQMSVPETNSFVWHLLYLAGQWSKFSREAGQ